MTTPAKPIMQPDIFEEVSFSVFMMGPAHKIAKKTLEVSMMGDFTPVVLASPM